MAESTRVSQEEMERRESCLRAYNRPRQLLDPLTWSYPAKTCLTTIIASIASISVYNLWTKKPWYYGAYMRGTSIVVLSFVGYGLGVMRAYNYRTRDAVIDHYMELHPNDFERAKDFYGRPFSQILMPWAPFRTQYWDFSVDKETTVEK